MIDGGMVGVHGFVMRWLWDAYLYQHVEDLNAEDAVDKIVAGPGSFLNEMDRCHCDESIDLDY